MDDDAEYQRWLLEAMREVDALTPACPPIAPRRPTEAEMLFARMMRNARASTPAELRVIAESQQNAAQQECYRALANAQAQQAEWLGSQANYAGQLRGFLRN